MKRLLHRVKDYLRPKAVVLMYHRIADLPSDVWDIAVDPARFEEQLQVLRQSGKVVPLRVLAEGVRNGKLQKGSIAITFDDGYTDNYLQAKPLLEKYGLPATFFITSGNLGQPAEFWWDELEHFFLFTPELPQLLELPLEEETLQFSIEGEGKLTEELNQQHRLWKGLEQEPPTQRASTYFAIWQLMRALPHPAQQHMLEQLCQWAGLTRTSRAMYTSMTETQLQQLASNPLFDIGIHTLTHPALALHDAAYQRREIQENRQYLRELTGNQIELLAYPFGNYNHETIAIASEAGLLAAVTTEEVVVKTNSNPYRLGRYQVKNWPGTRFREQLQGWISGKHVPHD